LLGEFFRKYGWQYAIGVIFLLLSAYLQNLVPLLLGRVIDALSAPVILPAAVYRLVALMMLISVIVLIIRYIWRYFINGNGRNLEAMARRHLFAHFQKMSAHFFVHKKTGDLMAYGINDINAIRIMFGPALALAVNSLSLAGIAIFNMINEIYPALAGFVLIPVPVIIAVVILFGREVRTRFRRVQEAFAAISDRVQENISGLRVVKAYVQEESEATRFEELNKNSRDANMRMVYVSSSMTPIVDILFGISFTIGLIYGSYLIRSGTISLGEFVAFNGLLALIVQPVRSVARIINVISRGMASYKRYNDILLEPITIIDGSDDAPEGLNHADLVIRNLTFKFPGSDRNVLQDISFRLKPGHTLGILGRTGSGKTTLVNLLLRLYEVPDDTIFFGGIDANRFGLNRLREPVGYVPQDNFLFSADVEDNIRFFNPEYSLSEVEQAACDAAILGNIQEFPEGFATQVGERGMSLSGGQKQRICIARALIKKPELLILDDSLSAVDTGTESEILKSIKLQTNRGGSAIIIAHRVSAIAACDEILVLDNGCVIERGTHADLIKQNGLYAETARDQMMADLESVYGEVDA
jgi:ATP-binding cassette subfamily B protein